MGINYIVLSLADAVPLLDCGRRTKPMITKPKLLFDFENVGRTQLEGRLGALHAVAKARFVVNAKPVMVR